MADNALAAIRERIDDSAALAIVEQTGAGPAVIDRKLYYPYYEFEADCTVPTLFGRKPFSAICLVDGINGIAATADSFAADRLRVPAGSLLRVAVTSDEACDIARLVLIHELGRRLRMIGRIDVQLELLGVIHKGFWVVGCRGTNVMIDSVTGGMYPLRIRAA